MKARLIVASVILVLVSACRDHDAADSPAATDPASGATASETPDGAATPVAPGDCAKDADMTNPLPSMGVSILVPCGLRSDRTYTTEAGIPRRQVTFEFIDPTADDALQAIQDSMLAAGFRLRKNDVQNSLARNFTKNGYGEVHVWANPDPGTNPRNPAASGAIGVDLPASANQ